VRTIFLHLREATEEQVASFLTEAFPSQNGPPWILAVGDDPCLYVDFRRNWQAESEPEEIECLRAVLGGGPSVSLSADVSGRHPGDAEVRNFVSQVLSEFDGVAEDEYTEGFWTKAEIVAEVRKSSNLPGRRERLTFFDHQGFGNL
jgi:hypothetical protein